MSARVHHHVRVQPFQLDNEQGDIVREPTTASTIEPLIGVTSAQAGVPSVALPSDLPGDPEPGLAVEQEPPA